MSEAAADHGQSGRDLPPIPVCGYSPRPGDPTVPLCNRLPAAHVTPMDRGQEAGWVLIACAEHAALAVSGCWDWHPWSRACEHPAAVWVRGTAFRSSGCAMPREQASLGGLTAAELRSLGQ